MPNISVAFDFDGTIIDVSHRDYAIYSDLIKELDGSIIPFELYWQLRRSRTDIYQILYKSHIFLQEKAERFLQLRQERMEDNYYLKLDSILPNTLENIENNRDLFNAYLVTTRFNTNNLAHQVERFKLNQIFERIICADRNKFEFYSAVPNLKIIVGDTENDIIVANTMGIDSVAVLSGIRNMELITQYNPTYICKSVGYIDFRKIINNYE